jgi:stage II sporulation protein R
LGDSTYETFALPSGVYNTLRIVIGSGEGKNWWCVAFPGLCMGATVEDFEEAASCAGFSDTLTAALETEEGYELRFYFLDLLGRIGNFLHKE